jgi:hypothetical protein
MWRDWAKMQESKRHPEQAAAAPRMLPNELFKPVSAHQRRSQFLVLDVEINLGGGAVLQNFFSIQLHVE